MPTIVDNCKIFWAVIFVAEVCQFFVKRRLPTIGGNLVELSREVEFALKQLPQFIHLSIGRELLVSCVQVQCTHFRCSALQVIVFPRQKQCPDLSVSRLPMTIVPLNGLIELDSGFIA